MIALAAVGRERENPRSERSEPAALKVQLGEVGLMGEGAHFLDFRCRAPLPARKPRVSENRLLSQIKRSQRGQSMGWHSGGAEPNL